MSIGPAFKRLWQHADFRRLLCVRVLGQAADGTLLVGMASYILFSPQNQPNAWAVAGVLALTLLPFTLLGPFVSTLLDRWSRRQVAVVSDIIRATLSFLVGVLIATGSTSGWWDFVLYGALLVAMSLNRFMLAGLSAGLQHTISKQEYLTASSVLPMVGPMGVVIGGVLGFTCRAGLAGALGVDGANAVVFFIAGVMFTGSVLVCRGFPRDALGPEPGQSLTGAGEVLRGIGRAVQHVWSRPVAAVGLTVMGISRFLFGLLSVVSILAFRNQFTSSVDEALGQITFWGLVTGAGFILASGLAPVLSRWCGLKGTMSLALVAGAVASLAQAVWPQPVPLLVTSFVVGLAVQTAKIGVDTIMQAHVDEAQKGRAFIIYDVLYNIALVTSAVAAAVFLPADGLSVAGFIGMGLAYLALAALVEVAARRVGDQFERGTEDLTVASAT